MKVNDFVIVVDSREKNPYLFETMSIDKKLYRIPPVRRCLPSGDYSILGYESEISLERKSVSDFIRSITYERKRFEREIEKLTKIRRALVLVEGRFSDVILSGGGVKSLINSESITGTVASWYVRYGIPFYFVAGREESEKFCFKILSKYYKYYRYNTEADYPNAETLIDTIK